MKKSLLFLCWFVILCIGMGLVACTDNDNVSPVDENEAVEEPIDELAILQRSLVKVDEDGNFVERIMGVPLDPADTTEVTVGVDSYEEAKAVFVSLFADTTAIYDMGDYVDAIFSTEEGNARLASSSSESYVLASAEFDVPGLLYISKILFIYNSSWPENSSETGFHKLGMQYEYKGWTGDPTPEATDKFDPDELHTFVCVREYNNGKPALLVGISKDEWYIYWRYSSQYAGNMPGKSKSQEISEILRTNWNAYKQYFNDNSKNLLNDEEKYWIQSGKDYGVAVYRDAIQLQTGSIDRFDVHWKEPRKKVLFFIESGQKG